MQSLCQPVPQGADINSSFFCPEFGTIGIQKGQILFFAFFMPY